jgi:hypothetical protein
MARIEEKAEDIDRLFGLFRQQQTELGGEVKPEDKQELRKRLKALEDELNRYLAGEYGFDLRKKSAYEKWLSSHKPFHWFIEFYGIVKSGGFDVIIGNPPYVAYTKVGYRLASKTYLTLESGNLYSFVMERSFMLQLRSGRFGMIVPVSMISGDKYISLAKLFFAKQTWISSFSNRPGKLFQGVEQRLVIAIAGEKQQQTYTSDYYHWYEQERVFLFQRLFFVESRLIAERNMPFKVGNKVGASVISKILVKTQRLKLLEGTSSTACWFHDGPTYWIRALPFEPNVGQKSERSNHYHNLHGTTPKNSLASSAILSSSLFYYFFKSVSNCRDFGSREIYLFLRIDRGYVLKIPPADRSDSYCFKPPADRIIS